MSDYRLANKAASSTNSDITSMTALTQITRATGGAFDIAIGGAAGDDFTVDTSKLVVEGDTGNVGIGTAAPGTNLHVYSTTQYYPSVRMESATDDVYGPSLVLKKTSASPANNDETGNILFQSKDSGGTNTSFTSILSTAKTVTHGLEDGYLSFKQMVAGGNIDVLTLDGGNVGIGTTAPNYQLELSTDSAGKPGAGGLWTVVSDERIKQEIELADLARCYEIVKQLPLKRFGWADNIYADEQVKDRHSLGWVAQDVQPFFGKSVGTKKFRKEKVLDGIEEYKEQDYTVETIKKEVKSIEIIDGKAVQIVKTISEEKKTMLFDEVEVVDEAGKVIMEQYIITPATKTTPAVIGGRPLMYKKPRMVTKTRDKFKQDVIEDCLDLNSGQIIAALYGCVQKLMAKVEQLEADIT
ncbi:MAG TPA: tail fiber domain-containing protein [Desulfatiglandales bacterium]|nr:tail fiber domain-containing protein [Desulfatiglandales bacterium]